MSHLPFAITAYLLNGVAVLIDKFMLKKYIPDPLVYIFYFSAFSILALIFLPFIQTPSREVILLASISTILWTTGAYLMFKALKVGQVSRVIPIIGSLIPLFLTLYYKSSLTGNEFRALFFLLLGLIFLILPYLKGKLETKELILEFISALLFASSYIVLKMAYDLFTFLPVLVWSRVILIPVGILILVIPQLRAKIFHSGPGLNLISRSGLLFLLGQAAGGGSEILITYSISLSTPALVNSLQGVQYIFLFIAGLILAKKIPTVYQETYQKLNLSLKLLGVMSTTIGIYLLAI